MKLLKLLALYIGCFLFPSPLAAKPQLPSKCEAFRPKLLLNFTVMQADLDDMISPPKKKASSWGQDGPSTNLYWEVFSDRSGNTVYEGPSESSYACGTLDFNEELRIASIKNGFALVYSEKQNGTQYPTISRRAEVKGWVSMHHLLLWRDCPTNEYGIYNKALIVGNIDKLKNDAHIGNYYTNPVTQEGKNNLRSTGQFFFVMKKDIESGLVLLAKESRVGGNMRETLFGWVSEGMYAPWSQRTCLEPNWDSQVVSDLRGERIPVYATADGKKPKGTSSQDIATTIEIGARTNSVSTNNPATRFRLDPNILRYPLLENDRKGQFYKITAFAHEGGSSAASTMAKAAEAEQELIRSLDNLRVVNIILVIDGTSGMDKYFDAALEAIRRANDYFGKENRKVQAGVVIYRDYTDGQYVTEYLSMRNAKDVSISDFLRKGGKYGVKNSPNDQTDTEALFKGLEVALDAKKMGYSPQNSNLMFVIGDCGNDPSDSRCLSLEEITKKCVDNRIQLLPFQVRNIQSLSYNLFRKQMGDIVVSNMKQQYSKLGSGIKLEYEDDKDGWDAKFDVAKESTFFIGGMRFAHNNQELDVTRLYALVMSTSNKFNAAVENQESKLNPTVITDDAISAIDENFIKGRISAAGLKALRDNKYLTAFEGFTPQKSQNDREFFKPVVYISHPELRTLMEQLKPVLDAAENHSDNRKPYVDAMKALVRSMLPDISESEMNKLDNTEIMNRIMGLNVRTNALETHTIIDIQSEQKVSKQQFDNLTAQFLEHYKKLETIVNGKYPFSSRRNGVRWFWIPAEDLP